MKAFNPVGLDCSMDSTIAYGTTGLRLNGFNLSERPLNLRCRPPKLGFEQLSRGNTCMKIYACVQDGREAYEVISGDRCVNVGGGCPGEVTSRYGVADLLGMNPEERHELVERLAANPGAPGPSGQRSGPCIPPLPSCPLIVVLHGNSPTIWKRQGPRSARWQITRVPFARLRPQASMSGHGETIDVPLTGDCHFGVEFGVVLGKTARNVKEEEAMEYVGGYTCVNDLALLSIHRDCIGKNPSIYERHSRDTLAKSVDGAGAMGPWITTADEIADPHNLLMYARLNGRPVDRSYTNSYLLDVPFLISYLSRFMTLPAGTVMSLGAAGWDGQEVHKPESDGGCTKLEVEVEGVGSLTTMVRFTSRFGVQGESPFLARRRLSGLPAPTWRGGRRPGRSFWALRGNYLTSSDIEGMPREMGMCPHLFPSLALGSGGSEPVVLPPHATTIGCACELAAVIGEDPVYRVSPEEVFDRLAGLAVLLSFHDSSLVEPVRDPTSYESRAAYFLGGCGDGFHRLGELAPSSLVRGRGMKVFESNGKQVSSSTSDYRFGIAEAVSMISRGITLLPGDVVSLGPAGERLVFPPAPPLPEGFQVGASIDGLGGIEILVRDLRTPSARDPERR